MNTVASHPLDQPSAPRIRTKICRLPEATDLGFFNLVRRLFDGDLAVEPYQRETLAFFQNKVFGAEFAPFVQEAKTVEGQLELVRRHLDHCRYTVLLYRVDEGEVHPPHHHHNVISTQIVVEGQLRIREFDRVRRDDDGTLCLKTVSDHTIGTGDHFQASEWNRNVHWFQAVGGPAIVFNTNARGFEPETFDADEGKFGRRYIDPTGPGDDSTIRCEEFDEAEAERRFQGRPLDEFTVGSIGP